MPQDVGNQKTNTHVGDVSRTGVYVVSEAYGDELWCICPECGSFFLSTWKHVHTLQVRSCGCSTTNVLLERNYTNHEGEITEFGVKIIKKLENNRYVCICPDCGREFIAYHSDLIRTDKTPIKSCKECSLKKLGETKAKVKPGDVYSSLTVIKRVGVNKRHNSLWLCRCKCGNEIIVVGSHLTSGNTKSCGCRLKDVLTERNKAHPRRGAENGMYNPDLTDEDRQLVRKTDPREYEWRNAVYKRDNFTCAVCGKRGGDLAAHHLEAHHANKNLRYDVNNGVTLCKECHIRFHTIYTYWNNTRAQFEEFRNNEKPTITERYNPMKVPEIAKRNGKLRVGHKASKGKDNPKSIKVINLTTREKFDSITDAAKKYGICPSLISRACSGVIKKTHGCSWAYLNP